jgi:RIO kinase 1
MSRRVNSQNLELLVTDGVVDEVVQQIKSGKEADVFLVRKGEGLLAAKVYKEREHRNFKNNAGYKEGRQARNSRDQRAMDKGSRFGREISEGAWKTAEADALFKLHAAGVRVPTPDVFYEGVLVMALVVDAEGRPAPRLSDTRPTREQALELHRELLRQIAIILTCDLIHGDLSAFNILLAHDGPTIIDLPQVVSAAHNSRAEAFLRRDVSNVTKYLGQYAPELLRRPDGGADLWSRYSRRELFAGYVPDTATLRDDTPFTGFRRERNNRSRRPRGPQPEVVYKGAPPASPAPSASPAPASGALRPPQPQGGPPRPPQAHGGAPRPPQAHSGAPRPPQQAHGGSPRPPQAHGGAPRPQQQAHGGAPRPPQPGGPRPQSNGQPRQHHGPPRQHGAPPPPGQGQPASGANAQHHGPPRGQGGPPRHGDRPPRPPGPGQAASGGNPNRNEHGPRPERGFDPRHAPRPPQNPNEPRRFDRGPGGPAPSAPRPDGNPHRRRRRHRFR